MTEPRETSVLHHRVLVVLVLLFCIVDQDSLHCLLERPVGRVHVLSVDALQPEALQVRVDAISQPSADFLKVVVFKFDLYAVKCSINGNTCMGQRTPTS